MYTASSALGGCRLWAQGRAIATITTIALWPMTCGRDGDAARRARTRMLDETSMHVFCYALHAVAAARCWRINRFVHADALPIPRLDTPTRSTPIMACGSPILIDWLEDIGNPDVAAGSSAQNTLSQPYPRSDSGARTHQAAADRAVELRALRCAGEARRSLLLPAQRWPAESERAVCGRFTRCARRACCSIPTR